MTPIEESSSESGSDMSGSSMYSSESTQASFTLESVSWVQTATLERHNVAVGDCYMASEFLLFHPLSKKAAFDHNEMLDYTNTVVIAEGEVYYSLCLRRLVLINEYYYAYEGPYMYSAGTIANGLSCKCFHVTLLQPWVGLGLVRSVRKVQALWRVRRARQAVELNMLLFISHGIVRM